MPERDQGSRAVLVDAEQEPLLQLGAKTTRLPPIPYSGVPVQCPETRPSRCEIGGFLLPPLLSLTLRFGISLGQLDTELAGEIQRRLDGAVESVQRSPNIDYVAMKAACETMDVITVQAHGRVGVM